MKDDPHLSEFNTEIHKLQCQQEHIDRIVDSVTVGPLVLVTNKLKLGLNVELKAWITLYCRHLNQLYRDKMEEVFEFTERQVRRNCDLTVLLNAFTLEAKSLLIVASTLNLAVG